MNVLERETLFRGKFGLERETLRVNSEGRLAQTPHPFQEEELSRDFCENQLEIITPVCEGIGKALDSLHQLSQKAERVLDKMGERLWISSNPPKIQSEDEIPIADYKGKQANKHNYRVKLEQRYGKTMMLYSGIHFNMSYRPEDIEGDSNSCYMKLLRYAMKYSWVITLLTAASPNCESWNQDKKFASMRNGERGYWNQFDAVLDYSSLENYCKSILKYVEKGVLFSPAELYLPIRIKPPGTNSIEGLMEKGISHIELRMFDLNPLAKDGIQQEDLQFAYLLLTYFKNSPDFVFDKQQQLEAIVAQKRAAEYEWEGFEVEGKPVQQILTELFQEMKNRFRDSNLAQEVLQYQERKLTPENRYAQILYSDYQKKGR